MCIQLWISLRLLLNLVDHNISAMVLIFCQFLNYIGQNVADFFVGLAVCQKFLLLCRNTYCKMARTIEKTKI